jgi:hypothetical protein
MKFGVAAKIAASKIPPGNDPIPELTTVCNAIIEKTNA